MQKRRRFAGLKESIVREVEQRMFAAGEVIAVAAQISITEGSVSGSKHVASRAGEAPNNDSGTLANSIQVIQTGRLKVQIIADAAHAVPLEFGTSRMSPRPFMAPAAAKSRPEVNRILSSAARAGVRKFIRR
jgi:HK97 gp10 family phage protein